MALSNIFKEPRREITETAVGLAVLAAVLVPDYFISREIAAKTGTPVPGWMVVGVAAIIVGLGIIMAALVLIHTIGEWVCQAHHRRQPLYVICAGRPARHQRSSTSGSRKERLTWH